MKRLLKSLASERLRLYARRIGRLRWITKARTLRAASPSAWDGAPLKKARYVLFDPEVDTFTYALANADELVRQLGLVLERSPEELRDYLREAHEDPELGRRLSRDIGWRAIYMKRRPALPSHHLSAWIVIRACKPETVVETGILEGLGSRTMLRALQLNAEEGHPGKLISFDVLPGAGKALVPARLRADWEPVYAPTPQALEDRLEGRTVGLFLHDSVQTAEHLRAEVESVLPHAVPGAVLMTVAGWTGVLEEEAERLGGSCQVFQERPADHFYTGRRIAWMRLPTG